MDPRRRLLDNTRDQSFPAFHFPWSGPQLVHNQHVVNNDAGPSGKEALTKIMDSSSEQLKTLISNNVEGRSQQEYVALWNTMLWPVLDVVIQLEMDMKTNTENSLIQELHRILSMADQESPLRRQFQIPQVSEAAGALHRHYLLLDGQLRTIESAAASNCAENQLNYFVRQFHSAVSAFNQAMSQILNSEASRVRSMQQHNRTSASAHQSNGHSGSPDISPARAHAMKVTDHLLDFPVLLDWCFMLVGSLISTTIQLLVRTLLQPDLRRNFAILHNEFHQLWPDTVLILCSHLLWVSTQPPMIMVTKTEFTCHCVLLNNYFIHDDRLHMQIVSEATAHEIQQKCCLTNGSLIRANPELQQFPAAGTLVMKKIDSLPLNPMLTTLHRRLSKCAKRRRRSQPCSTPSSAAPSPPPASTPLLDGSGEDTKLEERSAPSTPFLHCSYGQERLEIGWQFEHDSRMVVAEAEQACCTDRNLAQDIASPASNGAQGASSDRQRDIYYLHCWSKVAVFGVWYDVHTLSLPFVIPTRKNQDLQLHRMLKSYSATIFWLHVAGTANGYLIDWNDHMNWTQFSNALNLYFMREARVNRGLSDFDFMLLKEKAKCADCAVDSQTISSQSDQISYQNIICPHLFYQCGEKPVMKYSLWRALLDLIQLFQSERTKVRELWERGVLGGLWSMDSVTKILLRHNTPVLIGRISLLAGGSIILSFSSMDNGERVIHAEPLDQQHLNKRNLIGCIADIAEKEGIEYVLDCNFQPIPSTAILPSNRSPSIVPVRANSDQLGCPSLHRQYAFHTLKLSMVTPRKRIENGQRVEYCPRNGGRIENDAMWGSTTGEGKPEELAFELSRLVQQYDCSVSDLMTACQKLISTVGTDSC